MPDSLKNMRPLGRRVLFGLNRRDLSPDFDYPAFEIQLRTGRSQDDDEFAPPNESRARMDDGLGIERSTFVDPGPDGTEEISARFAKKVLSAARSLKR